MKDYIYYTAFLIYGLIGIKGALIYFKKELRQKVNMKAVWNLFWIVLVLRAFDVLSTIYFTRKIGIEHEANALARDFMLQLGIVNGIILVSILTIPLLFFWFVLVNFVSKDKLGWKIFKAIMIAVGVIVPLINLSA